jgi:hypothetical protein
MTDGFLAEIAGNEMRPRPEWWADGRLTPRRRPRGDVHAEVDEVPLAVNELHRPLS